MPSIIVFDLGNVLIPFDYGIMMRRLDAYGAGLGDTFINFYRGHYTDIHRAYERGDISDEAFVNPILTALENKVTQEQFCVLFSEIFTENTDVTALLPLLKQRYRVVLLSNTSAIHRRYGWGHYPFLQHFEKLFLSNELRAVKPEPAIYQAVMDYTKAEPAEHLFIDDIAEYVQGARDMGWNAVQFTGYDKLVADLNEYLGGGSL
jgi:putative hydrolase of the HAD superfamily